MKLETSAFRAEFDPQANNFTSLVNLATGDDYIKAPPRDPLVTLFALDGRQKTELRPGPVREEAVPGGLALHYEQFGGRPVRVKVECLAQGDRLTIRAKIQNESESPIVETLMPHLGGICLGATHTDDAIIYPHHAGERTVNPVAGYGVNKKDFWRASSVAFEDIYRREINYCGLASMSWMYYYDPENGLYFGSHDPRFPVTGVIAETSGSAADPWMGFGFRKHWRIGPGECWETGDYVLAVTTRDWHYGAELYRAYIAPHLDFDHTPAFLQDECALNQCYNFKRGGKIEHDFKDIPTMYEAGAAWGVRHMFLAGWNRTGFDSFYPEYYPDMELGSAMELRRGLEYVRGQGGFSTLYINARIFDTKSDFHHTMGERMALRNEKGEPVRETYGPEHFTVNCPSDALWREYLIDTAEFCALGYGCDGVYLDQLASAEPLACYNPEHSHGNIGEFNNGNAYVLKELLRRLQARNPNAYLMTENCGDIYGSYTWGNLTWNGAEYDEYYNVFKYTFPAFVQVNLVNPRGWETEDRDQRLWFYRDLHRAILLAALCGLALGIERKNRLKEAGMRTHLIVALGSALIMVVSKYGFFDLVGYSHLSVDASRVAAQIVSGIGFLGAGMIFMRNQSITGLTTAAGIWATAGIGMAMGAGLYAVGGFCTLLVLLTQLLLRREYRWLHLPGRGVMTIKLHRGGDMNDVLPLFERRSIEIQNLDMTRKKGGAVKLELLLKYPAGAYLPDVVRDMEAMEQVEAVEV